MPRRARSRIRYAGSVNGRKRVWADVTVAAVGQTTTGITDLLATLRSELGASTIGATWMGALLTHNALTAAGTPGVATCWQIGIVKSGLSTDAADLDPTTEQFVDWAWDTRYYVAAGSWAYHGQQGPHRIRSRRKIEEIGETMWIVHHPILGGATSLTYDAHVRSLLLLP